MIYYSKIIYNLYFEQYIIKFHILIINATRRHIRSNFQPSGDTYAPNFELKLGAPQRWRVRKSDGRRLIFRSLMSFPYRATPRDSRTIPYPWFIARISCTVTQTHRHKCKQTYTDGCTYLHTLTNAVTYAFWQWGVLIYESKFCLAIMFSHFVVMIGFMILVPWFFNVISICINYTNFDIKNVIKKLRS